MKGAFSDELRSNVFKQFSIIYQCHEEDAKFLWDIESTNYVTALGDFIVTTDLYPYDKPFYSVDSLGSRIVYLNLHQLEIVPESIKNLSELRSLSLHYLKSVSKYINHLKSLKELSLSSYSLPKVVPRWLFGFAKKNHAVNFTSEGVTSSETAVLGVLEILGYRLYKLKRDEGFPDETYKNTYEINNDGHIVMLNLELIGSNTGIITEQICELEHVEIVYFTGKPNVSLPQSIHKLKNLHELYIKALNVLNLTHNITNLKKLRVFDLRCVNITPVDDDTRSFLDQLKVCVFQTKINPYT